MKKSVLRFANDDRGATAIEYGLIAFISRVHLTVGTACSRPNAAQRPRSVEFSQGTGHGKEPHRQRGRLHSRLDRQAGQERFGPGSADRKHPRVSKVLRRSQRATGFALMSASVSAAAG